MNPPLAQSILIACVAAGLIKPPLLAQATVSGQASQQSGNSSVKVFILAGQSNMEGQAVADLGRGGCDRDVMCIASRGP